MKKIILILGAMIAVLMVGSAQAAITESIGVRPLKTEINVRPGDTKKIDLEVINKAEYPIKASPSLEAFLTNDSTGFPTQGITDSKDPQNILNWIKSRNKEIIVPAQDKVTVSFIINVPMNAEPGGRYAAIFYEPLDKNINQKGVQAKIRVASLLLIRVEGKLVEKAEILKFGLDNEQLATDQPVDFKINIKNLGNVHIKPIGKITLLDAQKELITGVGKITDEAGQIQVVDYIPMNANKGNVLPGSSRVFSARWENPESVSGITAKLELEYGTQKISIEKQAPVNLDANAGISNFEYDQVNKNFSLDLTNNGQIKIHPEFQIAVFNEFDFQVDEVSVIKEGYVNPGETLNITADWNKNAPDGKYYAKIMFISPMLQSSKPVMDFYIGSHFFTSLFSTPMMPIVIIVLIAASGIGLYILSRQKKSHEQTPSQVQA